MDTHLPSILCVDDDPAVLDLLKEYFTLEGFVVLTATNGVEAFLQVKQWMPRAVVMDLFMPRVSGMGHALDLVTEAGLSVAGALAKPLDLTKLSETPARVGIMAPLALAAGNGAVPARPVRAKVLVVDDELEMRKLVTEHLQDKGYEVLEAADGEEALARLPEYQPHMVLLDLMMRGIGGMETLRRIKAMQPEICVIMV